MSVRLRLTLWYATIFSVGLIAFAAIVWFGLRSLLYADVDGWLAGQSEGFERFVIGEVLEHTEEKVVEETLEFSTGLPVGSGVRLFDANGKLLLSRPESAKPHETESVRTVGGVFSVAGHEYRFVLWRSLEETEKALNRLDAVLFVLAPIFLLLSILGGWWLGRNALRPVDEITEAARRISFLNMSGLLPIPPHRDELQRLCLAWNEMLMRLDASAKRLTQFTADASHELRTPLAVIRTTAELTLRQDRPQAQYVEALRKIAQDSQQMTQMLESLMELARTDDNGIPLSFAPLDLSALVVEVSEEVKPLTSDNNVAFTCKTSAEDLSVVGDRGLLRRLLLLLLDNAIKFTPAPGRIEVQADRVANEALVEVRDTGIGIDDRDLPHIFDRFYQADGSRSGGGAGLGLSMAQWIVQNHDGRIEVNSTLGRGSLFRVFLPLKTREAAD